MLAHQRFRASSRAITVIVSAALAVVGWIIYVSPIGPHGHASTKVRVVTVDQTMPRKGHASIVAKPQVTPSPKHITVTKVRVIKNPAVLPTASDSMGSSASGVSPRCATFQWQQDAQAVYRANLSDPYALDGPAGPNNGNGLACDELPTDSTRPASKPAGAFAWAAAVPPTKAQVLNPSRKYFGLAADGLPGDSQLFDQKDAVLGQSPSTVEWFQNFGDPYPFAKVDGAWVRGALPVITWMSAPADFATAPDLASYSLTAIAAGGQDSYIKAWAASIAVQKMPVVIRFDHEENGNWYPWSIGWHKQGIGVGVNSPTNTAAAYVSAWQRVWNIFQSYGANNYAIWAYVPSRINTLSSYGTGMSQSEIVAAGYPGDQFVDWVGVDGYQYNSAESTTYSDTFAASFAALESFSSRPIFVAEMGSAQQAGDQQARWLKQTLAALAADPRVISAIYFDNDVTGVHYIDGLPVRTNWTIDSSEQSVAAVRSGISAGDFRTGIFPPYLLGD